MESVGFAISAAGLEAFFDACLHDYELFDQSKDFARLYHIIDSARCSKTMSTAST